MADGFLLLLPMALAAILLAALAWLRRRTRRGLAVIDGSNVMYWKTGTPSLEPVAEVIAALRAAGYEAGVMFDANAGYLLNGKYMHDEAFERQSGLRRARVTVVPKGMQADPYLLGFAQKTGAAVVSNDRFRDRIDDFPALLAPGRLVRGGYRDGRLWLDLPPKAGRPG